MEVRIGRQLNSFHIDDEDAYLLDLGYCFQVQARHTPNYQRWYVKGRKNGAPYLHTLIMTPAKGFVVDHINGDGRDNRRANLRLASRSQNMANQRRPVGASGYRGVSKMIDGPNWAARVSVNGKPIYRCAFPTAEAAARARDEMALEHFGEYAVLNFPEAGREQAFAALSPTRTGAAA